MQLRENARTGFKNNKHIARLVSVWILGLFVKLSRMTPACGAVNAIYITMLGLIFLYWIGKAFYVLAERNGKSVWGYAVLGIVLYYGGMLFTGVVIATVLAIYEVSLGTFSDFLISLMAFPFGLLSCWIGYRYLEDRWESVVEEEQEEVH